MVGQFTPKFLRIQFLNANDGWGFTRFSVVSTSDGGESWQIRDSSFDKIFTGISFLTPSLGWVSTENAGLMKTTDGGLTWTSVALGEPYDQGRLDAVKFINPQTGWITLRVSGGEHILRTTDGGTTWNQQVYLDGEPSLILRAIAAVDAQHTCVVGKGGAGEWDPLVWVTSNGGAVWEARTVDDPHGMTDVEFIDADNGWVVGKFIHRTTDGGATWTVQETPRLWFGDIDFVDSSTGWAVGADGALLKTVTGGTP
jgi:photosystem II stability/assembly factor-like uncharacterized protein